MIRYRKGFKYQLYESYVIETKLKISIRTQFVKLYANGDLHILGGYAWDGASGPTKDTKNSMRASLVHDALYQLIRMGELDIEHRVYIDKLFRDICREDGMSKFRSWLWYKSVKRAGKYFCKPGKTKPVLEAP